jgi:hypothetical protein
MRENPVLEKRYAFALEVVCLYRELSGRREYALSRLLSLMN